MRSHHKDPSFWAMMVGIVLTAVGAANPVHGTYFELIGILSIVATRELARRGW